MDHTFSLTARCAITGALGVVVCTARPAVGNRVPFVLPGVGAAATQANTRPQLGLDALRLLEQGWSPDDALSSVLAADAGRESRQLVLMNGAGLYAVFSGAEVLAANPWAGSLVGAHCVAAGNLLTGQEVLEAMVTAFDETTGFLGLRLLQALAAGQAAGGDKRGHMSAALLVSMHPANFREQPLWPLDVRVDVSPDPVRELAEVYRVYIEQLGPSNTPARG